MLGLGQASSGCPAGYTEIIGGNVPGCTRGNQGCINPIQDLTGLSDPCAGPFGMFEWIGIGIGFYLLFGRRK